MKIPRLIAAILTNTSAVLLTVAAEQPTPLSGLRTRAGVALSRTATTNAADGSAVRRYFDAHQPLGNSYRLLTTAPRTNLALALGGAQVFGYADLFRQKLAEIGQISPTEFAARFPSGASYLSGISWDPTKAKFWDHFNANTSVVNQGKTSSSPGYRTFDFRLKEAELGVFTNVGFVVSERLGSDSFADVFYKVWHNDLPVFISTDAILQAWHRTHDAMLEEIEETYLFNGFEKMLDAMAARVPEAWAQAGNGGLKHSVLDADYFLGVARSLLAGTNAPTVRSALRQDARVAATMADIRAGQMKTVGDFFGQCRVVDFSQFKVRGHYTHSERLGRYFQCVMWLGRIDFAVAGGPFERCPGVPTFASPREVGGAIILWHLLVQSGQLQAWQNYDRILQTFVGWTDSMTFPQLGGVLAAAGIRSLADVSGLATLQKLQKDILRGDLGVQNIRSDYFASPFGPEQIRLPRSFLVFGQKFVPVSWAFSQTVFDSILWVQSGKTNKVQRRVPSALDAAFAILKNNQVVPELMARMTNTSAVHSLNHAEKWRDGLPYQHNLAAVRAVMDAQEPQAWDSNLYMGWLAALRELSAPTTGRCYPEAMRTHAWAMKTLNTQLASWTQLRHDTILYAKQSYTGGLACFYPAGFVEPRVAFWQRLRETASRAAELIAGLPYEGRYSVVTAGPDLRRSGIVPQTNSVPVSVMQSNQVAHLRRFADTLATLQTLATKELAQECFTAEEELFIRNLDRTVFAGPVLSHYELEIVGEPRRLNDNEWKTLQSGIFPPDVVPSRVQGISPPPWTQSYLVPKPRP